MIAGPSLGFLENPAMEHLQMHLTESWKGLEMAACSGMASRGMGALPIFRRTPSEIEADHGVKAHRIMAHRQGHYYREDLE